MQSNGSGVRAILRLLIWVLILGGLGFGGYYAYGRWGQAKTGPRYETRIIEKGDVSSRVTATGTLEAVNTVTVGAQVSGLVERVMVDFNSQVRAGDVLARLDPSTLLAQEQQVRATVDNAAAGLANAQANLDNAMANVLNADAGIRTAQAAVSSSRIGLSDALAKLEAARANVRKAEAELAASRTNYRRFEDLWKRDLVARSELDQARTQYLVAQATLQSSIAQRDTAEAGYDSSEVAVETAQANLQAAVMKKEGTVALSNSARAQVQSAAAQLRKAQADLRQVQVNLSYTSVRSPIDGVVISRSVEPGQTIAASFQAPNLFTLAKDLRVMRVKANVDESDIAQVYVGQKARFTVDAYPEKDFEGTVNQVRNSPVTVQNVVTYEVLIDARNDKLQLRPGMTASIQLLVEEKKDVLLVPNMALRFRPEGLDDGASPAPSASPRAGGPRRDGEGRRKWKEERSKRPRPVYVLVNGEPTKREVVIGISDGTLSEVVSGTLKEGEEVILATATGEKKNNGGGPGRGQRRFF